MSRFSALLTLSHLVACVEEPDSVGVVRPSADALPASTEPGEGEHPGEASPYRAEIAARAQALGHGSDGLHASLGSGGLAARWTTRGAEITAPHAPEPLFAIQTRAWGRADHVSDFTSYAPTVTRCAGTGEPVHAGCVGRADARSGDLTEWWVSQPGALEQGWTVHRSPPGEGPVRIEVQLDGAQEVGASRIVARDGTTWRIAPAQAWDANGTPLLAWIEPDEDGFRVLVDDAGAAYPIEVDPIYTPAALDFVTPALRLGAASRVRPVGDVDGDGRGDLWVANTNAARLVRGGNGSPRPETLAELSSTDIFPLGDVNRDGRADIAWIDTAGVRVLYGAAPPVGVWTIGSSAATLAAPVANEGFGASLAVGDFNGDGYRDLAVGAHRYLDFRGRIYVYYGATSGLPSAPSTTLYPPTGVNGYGYRMAGLPDTDGDGFDELVVGPLLQQTNTPPPLHVHHGSATGLPTQPNYGFTGPVARGAMRLEAADFTGDGHHDLVIAVAREGNTPESLSIYPSNGARIGVEPAMPVPPPRSGAIGFAHFFATGGDVNADGADDLVVTHPEGRTMTLYYGNQEGVAQAKTLTMPLSAGAVADPRGVAISGNFDEGAADDLIVVANSADNAWDVFLGHPDGLSATAAPAPAKPLPGSNSSSEGLLFLGDLDGDGFHDVAGVGGTFGNTTVAVHRGRARPVRTDTDYVLTGLTGPPAPLGDLDGDGYDDLGTRAVGGTQPMVLFGGDVPGARTGRLPVSRSNVEAIVRPAGDVNGDGRGDVAVVEEAIATGTLLVRVFHGTPDGFGTTPAISIPTSGWNKTSYAVASTNLNGDAFDDLVLAFRTASTTILRVYAGSATGLGEFPPIDTTVTMRSTFTFEHLLGDVDTDLDGRPELIFAGATGVQICASSATMTSLSPCRAMTVFQPTEVMGSIQSAGDQNNDGNDDVVFWAPGSFRVLYARSGGLLASEGFNGSVSSAVTVGDYDGDGLSDFMAPGHLFISRVDADADGVGHLTDCDDRNPAVGVGPLRHYDFDRDGYGSAARAVACPSWEGFADRGGDCDDRGPRRAPENAEVCDDEAIDEDCDGLANDQDSSVDAVTRVPRFVDADRDGYGTEVAGTAGCDSVDGFAVRSGDCDDTRVGVNPGRAEVCDADNHDEDCDGVADNDDDSTTNNTRVNLYTDEDGDGWGVYPEVRLCDVEPGLAARVGDCNDRAPQANPQGREVCDPDDIDENCNQVADNYDPTVDPAGKQPWYQDRDGDGYSRVIGTPAYACDPPPGGGALTGDCNDEDRSVNPGGQEVCDTRGIDEDCDGLVNDTDDSLLATTQVVFYEDADGDDFGGLTELRACRAPDGSTSLTGDCDDLNPAAYPGADEVCDPQGVDENCNGSANDEDASTTSSSKTLFYVDEDSDGAGDATTAPTRRCTARVGEVANGVDCDDRDAAVHPAATEVCDPEGRDEDCDTLVNDRDDSVDPATQQVRYVDEDGDGFGTNESVRVCDPAADEVAESGDCDDADPALNPDAVDLPGDDIDQNCDGEDFAADDSGEEAEGDDDSATNPGRGCSQAPEVALQWGAVLAALMVRRRRRGPAAWRGGGHQRAQ